MAETFPDISSLSLTNSKPLEFSFSLPHSPQTNIHLHLTNHRASLLIFLTTASTDAATTAASLGSFVYAMPNRTSPSAVPLSTPLYTHSSTLDFATRLAKALARRVWKPVYVGNSISFANTGMGGAVEEEMEGFRRLGLLSTASDSMKYAEYSTEGPQENYGLGSLIKWKSGRRNQQRAKHPA